MELSIDPNALDRARSRAAPAALRAALDGVPAYLVGGAVRDTLLGKNLGDIDIAVEGELDPVLGRLGLDAHTHERFGTASVTIDGVDIDLARTRRETYNRPGSLPDVSPAPIRADLARRDFTINAIAIPIDGELEIIDPYDGIADLRAGWLRVIHPASLADDPTRALRAARYAVRLGFELEPATAELIQAADLSTVSRDRIDADLARLTAEPEAVAGLRLLAAWGLLELGPERERLLDPLAELPLLEPWAHLVDRRDLLLELVAGDPDRLHSARELAAADHGSASEAFELARGEDEVTLAMARALGATWIDTYVSEWRRVELTIDGDDLLAAGVPEGPEIGRGLRAARHARIEGAISAGREAELKVALAAARGDRSG